MGHPKKQKKKFSRPEHPWRATRIEQEKILMKDYGLNTKKEIWKADSILRSFKKQAKSLIAKESEQAKKEEKLLIEKLSRLSLINENGKIDDILSLNIKNILDRRLQTLIYKKNLAKTIKQARQFIVHGHINIDNKNINVPSHLVLKEEEPLIKFNINSKLHNEEHPERIKKTEITVEKKKREIKKPAQKRTKR
jgi:small subunit ribosomal protein S4